MIQGVHLLLYSRDAEADRAFLHDVPGLASVDAGHGWLIFGLPPAEIAVHPADGNVAPNAPQENQARSEIYLMCDDLPTTIASFNAKGAVTTEPKNERWGTATTVRLPSGASLGLYQPRHATALHLARQ
jgi:predicted enzyme related to lactoylglutathione lyase